MTTLVLERTTPMETLFSFMGASEQVRIVRETEGAPAIIAPVIDPDDYGNDTDYLNAIPGMAESIIELMNAPDSEFEDVPEEYISRNV
jgi:hypothetical protein